MANVALTLRTREALIYEGAPGVSKRDFQTAPRNFTGFLFIRAFRAVCAVRDAVR